MTVIKLKLTTLSRFHSTPSVDNEGKKMTAGSEIKYTLTTNAGVILDKEDGGTSVARVPVINANQLRGRIRRNIAERMFNSLRERNVDVNVDLIHLLTSLATSAGPYSALNVTNALKHTNAAGDIDPVEFFNSKTLKSAIGKERSANEWLIDNIALQISDPFCALFGGGPNMWESRLVINDMLPHTVELASNPFLANHALSKHFVGSEINVLHYRLTELVGTTRGDDLFKGAARHAGSDPQGVQAWVEIDRASNGRDKKGKDDTKVSKFNLSNMMVKQAVITGVPFINEIIVKEIDTPDQTHQIMVGMMLLGCKDLGTGTLGSQGRDGWGKMDVAFGDKEDQAAIDAAESYIANFDPVELMGAYGIAFR